MSARADISPEGCLPLALEYAAHGWKVLPIRPGDKRPASRHGLHDATGDPDVIRSWWGRCPRLNVGLRSGPSPDGSGFDVVDIDSTDDLSTSVLRELLEGDGPMAGTPRLGAHLLYQATGQGNRAGLFPGVDYRGQGGYIVAPPSVGATGQRYVWGVHWQESLTEVGPLVRAALCPPPPPVPPRPAVMPRVGNGYVRAAVAGEVALVLSSPVGGRNHALNGASFNLGTLVGGGLLDEFDASAVLTEAGHAVGLTASEVTATVASGLRAGREHPRPRAS